MTLEELRASAAKIPPGEVLTYAREVMAPEDIDHYCSDLYLRKNEASDAILEKFEFPKLVGTFRDNIDHDVWYEYPFCYWEEKKACQN